VISWFQAFAFTKRCLYRRYVVVDQVMEENYPEPADGSSFSILGSTGGADAGAAAAAEAAAAAGGGASGKSDEPSGVVKVMNLMTNAFPLWVVAGAVVGLTNPALVTWFKGSAITVALAVTMLGMGLTLDLEDFIGRVVHSRPPGCQIGYMDLRRHCVDTV
jgi:hypothetical protein